MNSKVALGFLEELELRNTRPLDPDLLALFFDGEYVEVKDGDRLKPACIYLAIGLARDGKKRGRLPLEIRPRESGRLEAGLRSLIERGLRCVLMVVHDDFSGLLRIIKTLFSGAMCSSARFTYSATPEIISLKSILLSSNSVGVRCNPPGTNR